MDISETREYAKPRSKPRIKIEEPRVKKQRRKSTQKKKSQYARVPHFFASAPASFGLDVIETAIVMGLIRGAHTARHDRDRKIALNFAGRMHAEKPQHVKQSWMSKSYYEKMEKMRAMAPTDITFDTTRFKLLKLAMVSCGTPNRKRVTEALDRFLDIAAGPLEWYQDFPDGSLRCCVSEKWLARKNWRQVPVPLPTRSLAATNLALFLRCISGKGVGIKVETLSTKVGVTSKARFAQRQAISRARKQVNAATWLNILQGPPKQDWEEPDHFF